MQFRLRTLLILLAVMPPMIAGAYSSIHCPSNQHTDATIVMCIGDGQLDEWLPWYPPGTPQASALCKQSAEREPRMR